MTDVTTFGPVLTLGEGPLWHPERERLFWFDIPSGTLHASNAFGGDMRTIGFGEPASACGWVDRTTLLVATATGLQRLDLDATTWETVAPLEEDDPVTRSNDGRAAPDGSFWIGTMGRGLEREAGAYYRFANGEVTKLIERVSIPNATCFSADGRTAYLADTARQTIWRWALDETGAPQGEREVHVDLKRQANPDGAVVDGEGCLWVALYGAGALARFDETGKEMSRTDLPASQPTCPAFGGDRFETLFVTTAADGIDAPTPEDGRMLALDPGVAGRREPAVRL